MTANDMFRCLEWKHHDYHNKTEDFHCSLNNLYSISCYFMDILEVSLVRDVKNVNLKFTLDFHAIIQVVKAQLIRAYHRPWENILADQQMHISCAIASQDL